MQRNVLKGLLAAAMIGGMAVPALAQNAGGSATAFPAGQVTGARAHAHGPRSEAGHPGLQLAERLSALETLVGITAAQQPAWRSYTDALLAFVETDRAAPGATGAARPEGQGPEAPLAQGPAGPQGGGAAQPAPQILQAERLAERAVDRGARAETLRDAAAALRGALSPEQLARLIEAEAPRRMQGHGGPQHVPGTQRPDARPAD